MDIAETTMYPLGRFMVIAKPLEQNPFWQTHWVYLRGALIGKQLSVPSIADCCWHERNHGQYATAAQSFQHFKKYGKAYKVRKP